MRRAKPVIPAPSWASSEEKRLEYAGRLARAWIAANSTDRALLLWLVKSTDSVSGVVKATAVQVSKGAGASVLAGQTALKRLERGGLVSVQWGGNGRDDIHVIRVTW